MNRGELSTGASKQFSADDPCGLSVKSSRKRPRRLVIILLACLVLVLVCAVSFTAWYKLQLRPVDETSTQKVKVTVNEGDATGTIAATLSEAGVIRSETAFLIHTYLHGVTSDLRAGAYTLNVSMSVQTITDELSNEDPDTFTITFYPGATLRDSTQKPLGEKTDVKTMLLRAGYDEDAVEAALKREYTHPLLETKPPGADIEGYVYGETYEFRSSATPEEVLERTFDEMYSVIQENNLVALYKKRGLSLYEGITLASIIQREEKEYASQQRVAQVFYLRLKKDMPLGSDPTYQYIADKTGMERDPALDSEYNTRKVKGLPPGPISAPGNDALLATAHPAKGDYLYFLSGDDDKMYFGRTIQEHEANIEKHCQQKCTIL
jgi:UPF0755 protein